MNRSAALRLGLLASMWGPSFLFIKVGLEGFSAIQVVLGRLVTGAAVLGVILALRRERLPRRPVIWLHSAAMAVVANILPFFGFAWGEERVSSSLAGIYNAATPLLTLVIAIAMLPEERATPARAGGLVLGFLGVLTVLGPWQGLGGGSLTGQLACLAAAACYGLAIPYTRKYLSGSGYSPLVLAASQLACASVGLGLLAPFVATDAVRLSVPAVLSVLALGAIGTGLAYLLYFGLIRDIGATSASTVTYLVPVVAVFLGVAVLGESVAWHHFAGAAVVVLGVAVAEGRLRLSRRQPARA